ncbi:SHIRT domain-containing protein [Parvimonas sp. G1967]|uniref:SHIRT domain-containing protein n=1 Tax=Parvimonas sp. G1967 TaxID=3387695 RepID=UPI0039E51F5E
MKKIISKILILTMLVAILPKVSFAEREKVEKNHNVAPMATQGYSVNPDFVSGTKGKNLPDGVLNQLPQSAIDVPKGFKYPLKTDFKEVKADGGIWKFKRWEKVNADGTTTVVINEVQVINDDIKLNGVWEFEKDTHSNKFKILYRFVAVPDDRELPEAVKNKKPADQYDVPNGTKVNLPKFDDVKVEDGTWKFITWKVPKNNQVEPIENEAIVENEDLRLQGEWKFEKDKKPEPQPKKYNVTFEFKSITDGKELPDEIKAKVPANKSDVESGTKINLPKFDDIKVEGGTWKFITWKAPKNNQVEPIENEAIVENEDLRLQGEWKFEEDKKTGTPKPEISKPESQKPKVQKGRMLPKTNVESAFTYVILALAGIGGAYITKKKDEE